MAIPILTVRDDNGNEIPIPAIKGKDGKDGKDGYNPVKGVDYFDGEKGDKGDKGDNYVITASDKAQIAQEVKALLTKENWTFTLEDGSTVTKAVYVS